MRRYLVLAGMLVAAQAAHADDKTTDFAVEAKLLFRIGACGSDDAIPERLGKRAIDSHCKSMTDLYASYKRAWADKAGAFIANLRPSDLPRTVVYPFGGGDLTSALVVFPDATEVTTLSLEAAGDVRAVNTIKKGQLSTDLGTIGGDIRRLYRSAHSTTKSLQAASHSQLPGSLMFALAGLAVHGMEPVGLRYFDLQPDGTLAYLTNAELDARVGKVTAEHMAKVEADRKKVSTHAWVEQEHVFANVEIKFKKRGEPNAPVRTYRHIKANLDDTHMAADDRVLDHLRAKGKVSVITKAASFLLWYDDFTQIRGYLLKHLAWMVSDASGIPPSYAGPAGFEQVTYGTFVGPYFVIDKKNTRAEFIRLWRQQPQRELPFRFGYPDAEQNGHLMITRPKGA